MNHSARRYSLFALIFLGLGAMAGGLLGDRVQAEAKHAEDGLWTFGHVLALVEDEYVGKVDSEQLVRSAIEGMLLALDPHTNFLDADAFAEMRDEQRGKFSGLGIQITKRAADKPLTIIAPIDGTPAWRAGLQSGDIISEIEGQPTMDMTVQQAVRLLKGDRGTKVTITIERPGAEESFPVTIERDDIPIQSVRVSYMIGPKTGVVRIGNFTSTTATELDEAVDKLRGQGMSQLILDLRSNPGGLLEQAVEVSERFIDPGKLIVYTQGRIPGSDQRFVARDSGAHVDLPLIVLVDSSSASASEIVSGAIQDHDRGLVVGETTFGKGLVQRVIPIQSGEGGALAVTTAKYYTPSGRLIQRDYTDLDDYYLSRAELGEEGDGEGEAHVPMVAPQVPEVPAIPRETFHTEAGRDVFGGGGITPDYVVKTPRPSDFWFKLNRENLPFDFAVRYVARHPELKKGFKADGALLEEFKTFLRERQFSGTAEEFAKDEAEVADRLRVQIARIKWDQEEEARVRAETDPQIQRALGLFEKAAELQRHAPPLLDPATQAAVAPLPGAEPAVTPAR